MKVSPCAAPVETPAETQKRRSKEPKVWTSYCGRCLAPITGTAESLRAEYDKHCLAVHGDRFA